MPVPATMAPMPATSHHHDDGAAGRCRRSHRMKAQPNVTAVATTVSSRNTRSRAML
jgi:hypothetical protein